MSDHIMIDLETLDTTRDAIVVSVGAVAFDPLANNIKSSMYLAFDIDEQLNQERVFNINTIRWWLTQSNEARKVFQLPTLNVRDILVELRQFILDCGGVNAKVWANSPSFDLEILKSMNYQWNVETAWKFWNERDVRTIKSFLPKQIVDGVAHNALDDALHQVKLVQQFYKVHTR